ncbi:MAG TPA: glycosyltransferase family 4 protein [Polyangiaceae bacterium]|nr:glycosyltransferase family 4 protein [Polyangiaceae bacterium]
MHIAYLFDRPLPAKETDSEQVMNTVAALARRGVKISLILPQPKSGAPSGASAATQLRDYYQVEGDFAVHLLPTWFDHWPTGRKWLHAKRSIAFAQTLNPDLLYTRNFPALFQLARQRLPYAYETYRPWGDQFPVLRPPFRAALNQPHCLGAVLHSTFAKDRYQAWGVPSERLAVVLNGYDPKNFAQPLSKSAARAALGLPAERPLVVYTGHINATKGLDIVMALAKLCPEVDFLLVGSEGKGVIELMARSHPNVKTVPWQPFDRTAQYLYAADVLLLPPSRIPLRVIGNTVLPMKLFLYLAAGRPILGGRTPDTAEILHGDDDPANDGSVNAVRVPPGDAPAAAAALKSLLTDPDRQARLSQAALQTATGLTWDARAEKLEAFLRSRLSAGRPST